MHHGTEEAARFWGNVDQSGDCWLWLGWTNHNGYGRHMFQGRRIMAHRVAYILTVGEIPDGLQLDHLCRVRRCVNPAHLEPVTQHENILRSDAPTAINARRDTCIHGHDFTPTNTYVTPDGRRQCRTCIRRRLAESQARRQSA